MINIQVHRSAIGLYLDKAQSLSSKGKGRLSFFVESSKKRKVVKISRYELQLCNMYAIKRWRHRDESRSNLQLGEIVNYLVKLQAFSVHVMHYMHYVGLR